MKSIIDQAVDRFLCWKLPVDFAPDCGISFIRGANPNSPPDYRYNHEPTGTNLFTADQAKAMFTHVLQGLLEQPEAVPMDIKQIRDEANHFFEWPTPDKTHVTTTSMLIFCRAMMQLATNKEREVCAQREKTE